MSSRLFSCLFLALILTFATSASALNCKKIRRNIDALTTKIAQQEKVVKRLENRKKDLVAAETADLAALQAIIDKLVAKRDPAIVNDKLEAKIAKAEKNYATARVQYDAKLAVLQNSIVRAKDRLSNTEDALKAAIEEGQPCPPMPVVVRTPPVIIA